MCRRGRVSLWWVVLVLVLCGVSRCHSISTFEYSAMIHHLGSLSVTTVG